MKKTYDLIIYGGSITGCLTAISAAKKGYSVVLIEKKSFLGDNITSGLNTGCDEPDNAVIKFRLLEALEKYGVEVLLMSDLTAVAVNGGYATGVLISNRFGMELIYARAIIDATGFHRAVEMADNVNLWSYNGKCGFCMKYAGENIPEINSFNVPENINITKSHDGGLFVNFTFDVKSTNNRYSDLNSWNLQATLLCEKVDNTLMELKDLRIIQASYEVCLTDIKKSVADSTKYKNVKSFCFPFDSYKGFSAKDIEICMDFVTSELEKISFLRDNSEPLELRSRDIVIPFSECEVSEFDDFKMQTKLYTVKFDYEKFLPVTDNASVLVAGGGTAGFAAAIGASTETENVVIADENTGFGGTQTYGSVCRYYHGYLHGFANKQEAILSKFSPIYKRISYLKQIMENNIRSYTGVNICATVNNENEINGIVISNSDLWGIIKSEITVDATGNADLVDFCGLKTTTGSLRDGNLQDYSQSVIERSGLDLDVIDHCRYSEILRGLRLGHAQYKLGDFSTLITPRATRCFEGDYKITLKDILFEKRYPDTIAIAHTDNDAHGALSSVIHYMGFVPYHDKVYTMEIPLSACIVKNFDRLLVVGKSLSATPDAAGFFRMAADIINRGYAAGLAAAMAAGKSLREIDYPNLKKKLVSAEILPETTPKEELPENEETALLKLLCEENPDINSLREEYLKTNSENLAITLAWFGDSTGKEQLKARLKELLKAEESEHYTDVHPWKPGNNKGGVMGEAELYWQINRIITALALIKDTACTEEILTALNAFNGGGSSVRDDNDYVYGRIDLQRIPHFDRIRVLCFYIKNCPDSVFIRPLESLLKEKGFGGFVTKENIIGRNYQNSYIELTLIRTLARCGSPCGMKMLADYLSDIHFILAKNAHDELFAISGKDFGYDPDKWNKWILAEYSPKFTPCAYENNKF
ncbi:MAG: FAD-dependent oxidoreductase [Clostridia bacterium]|nr:FAD-dependent oxidoreductase [Clostridia bacterium]